MKLGKGLKVRMKCPLCARLASLDPATAKKHLLVYRCYHCGIEWYIRRDWKQQLIQSRNPQIRGDT